MNPVEPPTPFEPGTAGIAFFSRGRGSGHAVPDAALFQELRKLNPAIDVRWISYGTGAATLRDLGYQVIDLQLPDTNPFLETQMRATRVLSRLRPHLVIAHEEFSAAPAAKLFGLPVIFITDYFAHPETIWMESLRYADEIVFIDESGVFEEPPFLKDKVRYVGPFVRDFTYTTNDRTRARSELGLPPGAVIVLVLPGNWFNEERAPAFDLVIPAFHSLTNRDKLLIWFAGQDYHALQVRAATYPRVMVKDVDWQIDRWMVACDVAITKSTRKTSLELASLGVPSVSLSYGLNFVDDVRVSRIATNTHLKVKDIDSGKLAQHLARILATQTPGALPLASKTGLSAGAQRLAEHVARIRPA